MKTALDIQDAIKRIYHTLGHMGITDIQRNAITVTLQQYARSSKYHHFETCETCGRSNVPTVSIPCPPDTYEEICGDCVNKRFAEMNRHSL